MHRISQMNRRILLQRGALAAAGFAVPTLGSKPGQAAVPPDAARVAEVNRLPLFGEYRYAHMVQEYYVARLRRIARTRRQARAAIETPEQVMQLRAEVRQKLAACYGPRPARTPLKPRLTGTVERPDYRIEKVSLDELAGLEETAHLLRSPANARRLLESVRELRAGGGCVDRRGAAAVVISVPAISVTRDD